MTFWIRWPLTMLCSIVSVCSAAAPHVPASGAVRAEHLADVVGLARAIDRRIGAGLKDRGVTPAPRADDYEFARRVYLDLTGRIPKTSEVRAFLDDRSPDKRSRLVERLLRSPNYVTHFTYQWRSLLVGNSTNQQVQFLNPQIENWARSRVRDNVPYDRIVRELLTVPVVAGRGMTPTSNSAAVFYQINELKPDMLAAATSRLFLGVKLECAQCHDHPFANWTRKQFWEYTAFFGGIKPQSVVAGVFSPATDNPNVREIAIGDTNKKVQAKFLDGSEPNWKPDVSTRETLAEWMTRPDNPFFARAVANRMWEHFFGVGLVDPVDDFRDENPASHPELVDELAKGFVASNFDLKFLIRAIIATETYQRTSQMTHPTQEDLRSFARMPLKGLTPEQVFDSLATAVGYRGDTGDLTRRFGVQSARNEIQSRFTNPVDRRTEVQTSILQALSLMNGKFVADATSLDRSETLLAVIDSPFMNTKDKLDTLYLAALSRPMRESEASRLLPYVTTGGPSRDSRKALADVFWVLLNSSEFILNH
ncbi:MAG: DUF1553 domain-containing protein [Planctomycetia bacterium]|nr:DUF1553 domain-containing protein [Planctomycetia bacterium]